MYYKNVNIGNLTFNRLLSFIYKSLALEADHQSINNDKAISSIQFILKLILKSLNNFE